MKLHPIRFKVCVVIRKVSYVNVASMYDIYHNMANIISIKQNTGWNLNKSEYDETEEFPLMSSPGPVSVIVALYLLFVLKLGPDYMRQRNPYKLTTFLVVYNALQVALSAYLVQRFFRNLLVMGLTPQKCYMHDTNYRKEIIFGAWCYLAAKVTELLDTVFFVLRRKDSQITFLHLYHHSCMVIATWALLKYCPSESLIFTGFLNSLVHVFMYTYYGLAALGPSVAKYLTWKKHMTTFQLVQFVCVIIQYIASTRVSDCPPPKGVAIFYSCNAAFFLLLFVNFYIKSYRKKNELKICNNEVYPLKKNI